MYLNSLNIFYNGVVIVYLDYLLTQKDDYKSAIVAIISRSNESITVNKVLIMFQEEYGYTFPFQKFFCRSYMDFFRLYPHIFKVTIFLI